MVGQFIELTLKATQAVRLQRISVDPKIRLRSELLMLTDVNQQIKGSRHHHHPQWHLRFNRICHICGANRAYS